MTDCVGTCRPDIFLFLVSSSISFIYGIDTSFVFHLNKMEKKRERALGSALMIYRHQRLETLEEEK